MTQNLKTSLQHSPSARWIALVLVSLTMLTGYFFSDVMSPLKPLLIKDAALGWTNEAFGFYFGAYSWFNVFLGMLILGGIILDKKGIRFTGTTFVALMVVGASLNFYALTDAFAHSGMARFLGSFLTNVSPSAKMAALGYAIFGVGVEIAGITTSRIIVKWFKGKEMALAMGLQVATARIGMLMAMTLPSRIVGNSGDFSRPVAFGIILLCIGLISYIVYCISDSRLDREMHAAKTMEAEEEFKFADLKNLFTNPSFLFISFLCVLFYSAVFPFMKYAPDLMVNKFGVDPKFAGDIPSLLPLGTMALTPLFGWFLDTKGKGASIMLLGSSLLIIVHLLFAFGPNSLTLAIGLIILLGIAFSLVPSAMWPAVPKIVDERCLGTAFSVIFWIQNIGLMTVPMLIGYVLEAVNPGVTEQIKQGVNATYDYTIPMIIFAGFGIAGLGFAFLLKWSDKKQNFGLEKPNKK